MLPPCRRHFFPLQRVLSRSNICICICICICVLSENIHRTTFRLRCQSHIYSLLEAFLPLRFVYVHCTDKSDHKAEFILMQSYYKSLENELFCFKECISALTLCAQTNYLAFSHKIIWIKS